MSENVFENEKKSNVITGIIGALLGALLGAVLWVVLYQLGIIAAIAGYIIAFLAFKGYVLLGKSADKKGAIIALVVSLIVITTANFLCWSFDIYTVFIEEYDITFMDAVAITPEVIFDSENIISFLRDLGIGYVLMIVGFVQNLKSVSGKKEAEEPQSEE